MICRSKWNNPDTLEVVEKRTLDKLIWGREKNLKMIS
jgi:hypothetical protein